MTDSQTYNADHPISSADEDRLDFHPLAQGLAKAVREFPTTNSSFVMAIEGSWGSGKSSLLKLILNEIHADGFEPPIINFAPWRISSTETLLTEFFDQLAEVLGDRSPEIAKWFRIYARFAAPVAQTAQFLNEQSATLTGVSVPMLKPILKALTLGEDFAAELGEHPSLEKVYAGLYNQLSKLETPIIMDDLDRLTPNEASEIMRLVKSVANFPNVIYVLLYDRENLAALLEQGVGVIDGNAYLDKVVQTTVPLPAPHPAELPDLLITALLENFASRHPDEIDTASVQALKKSAVLKLIRTPRDVVRIINALHWRWPVAQNTAFFPDLVLILVIEQMLPTLGKVLREAMLEFVRCGGIKEGFSYQPAKADQQPIIQHFEIFDPEFRILAEMQNRTRPVLIQRTNATTGTAIQVGVTSNTLLPTVDDTGRAPISQIDTTRAYFGAIKLE